jgi:hypothetical protein
VNWLKRLFAPKHKAPDPYKVYLDGEIAKIDSDPDIPVQRKFQAKLEFFLAENKRLKANFIRDCSRIIERP